MEAKQWEISAREDGQGNPCGIDITTAGGEIVCRIPDGATPKGGQAWPNQVENASLIVAAPQLRDACERLLALVGQLMPGVQHIALQDYTELNDAPVAARRALYRAKTSKQAS